MSYEEEDTCIVICGGGYMHDMRRRIHACHMRRRMHKYPLPLPSSIFSRDLLRSKRELFRAKETY
jgi:hypothetical protein